MGKIVEKSANTEKCQEKREPINNLLKQGMINENGEAYEPHASIITSTNIFTNW